MSSAANSQSLPARSGVRSSSGVQRSSAVQRYFETSLFLMVATGALSIVSTGKLDLVSSVAVTLAIAVKAFRLWHGRGPELSARIATSLVLAYFLFFPLDLWVFSRARAEGAPNPALYAALLATIHLLLFATIVRLYSASTNRDHSFLAVLAVASMLASAILTVETGFLVSLAIFLALAVSTFVALEMRRAGEDSVSPPLDPESPLARRLNHVLGATSILVAISALALGLVIFFLIPRFTTGYMSAFNLQPNMQTGFSDDMTLGAIGQIQQNPSVVMRIQVEGDPAQVQDMHWRGIVLTTFDGKRWFTPASRDRNVILSNAGVYSFDPFYFYAPGSPQLHYTVIMEPLATRAIFVAPQIEVLRGNFPGEPSRLSGMMQRNFLTMDGTDSIFARAESGAKLRYEALSRLPNNPPQELRRASDVYPETIRQAYLQVPPVVQSDPRIRQLAQDATAHASNPYDKAASLALYLKTHYAYTLDLRGDPGEDPLAYFLFERRAGHCEYFASAMTIMLREIGIPARYATGFLGGEYNDVGKDYMVRASDAHAWVEVYFPGHGWVTFDPTPGGEKKQATGMLDRMSLYWDWFQLTWSEWIVNYDFAHQIKLGSNTQVAARDYGSRLRDWYRLKQEQAMRLLLVLDRKIEASRYSLPSLLAFLILLLFWMRGRVWIRDAVARWKLGARRGSTLTPSLAVFEYQEMLKLLEKRGWKKSPSQTPREFAAALPAPHISAHVMQLTELYHEARFGSRPPAAVEASSLLRSIRLLLRGPAPSPR